MPMKKIVTILCLLIVAATLFGCGTAATTTAATTKAATTAAATTAAGTTAAATTAGSTKTVKIGVYGSITGVNSESGRQAVLAAEAARDYINGNGGIKALGGAKVENVIIDSTSDATQAALPLERALSAGGIAGIAGSSQSAIMLSSLQILQKYKVCAVTGSAANGTITQQGCEFVCQPGAIAATFAPQQMKFLEYLAEKLGKPVKELKTGIIYENSAWGEDNAKANRTVLAAAGMTIAVDENYAANALTDASPIVTKLKNAKVDVIFPSSYANDTKLIMTAMNAMQYKPIIIAGGSAFTWPSLLKDLGSDVNGICSADGWVWDCKTTLASAEFTKIREAYEAKNKEFIPGQGGPTIISYLMICEAIENAKSDDSTKVRDELKKLNATNSKWFGLLYNGKGEFDKNGFNKNGTPIILQWQDNKPRCVFPLDAASSPLLNPLTNKPF